MGPDVKRTAGMCVEFGPRQPFHCETYENLNPFPHLLELIANPETHRPRGIVVIEGRSDKNKPTPNRKAWLIDMTFGVSELDLTLPAGYEQRPIEGIGDLIANFIINPSDRLARHDLLRKDIQIMPLPGHIANNRFALKILRSIEDERTRLDAVVRVLREKGSTNWLNRALGGKLTPLVTDTALRSLSRSNEAA